MLKKIVLLGFVLVIGLQFFRPHFENQTSDEHLSAEALNLPPTVHKILQRSCFDCHSNTTQLRWYDQVMPAYALVVSDVKKGRAYLNFSDWQKLSPGDQKNQWFTAINQILNDGMPLNNYLTVHPEARVSEQDREVLKNYVGQMMVRSTVISETQAAAKPAEAHTVAPTLNGIAFNSDYVNWKVINTTDRIDNGTARVILGNSIAVKALQEKKINPWPTGTSFAKVAWKVSKRADGLIHNGPFFQVEFMTKDENKYDSSLGWGFARWRGNELKPYGKDAGFTQECITCHAPMKSRDFVYTDPTQFRDDRVGYRFVSSVIDPVHHTMSTTYGRGGEKITDTYDSKPDAQWFGANVPGTRQSSSAAVSQEESEMSH